MTYLNHPLVQERLAAAPLYQKSAPTLLRQPRPDEWGDPLETWVKTATGLRRESVAEISATVFVARNPDAIGEINGAPLFNEWLLDRQNAAQNYGEDQMSSVGLDFAPYRKSKTLRMIVVDDAVLKALGAEHDELHICVPWSKEPMIAQKGDFLTDEGYSVSAHDAARTYAVLMQQSPRSLASKKPY